MKTGECCSDYGVCEMIAESYTTISKIPNCKFASQDKSLCLQCKDNFYLYNNKCELNCPKNTKVIVNNKICVDFENKTSNHIIIYYIIECSDKNCDECDSANNCYRCFNSHFLYDNSCLKSCPVGLRANRLDFTCREKSCKHSFI